MSRFLSLKGEEGEHARFLNTHRPIWENGGLYVNIKMIKYIELTIIFHNFFSLYVFISLILYISIINFIENSL